MGLSLSSGRVVALLALMRELAHTRDTVALRGAITHHLLDLFEADYLASYEWNPDAGRFEAGVYINMDPANLARYEAYYQYRDPITFKLQARRHATAVVEVMPQDTLVRTEFFNDFLSRDGLWWGMNVYAYDGPRNVGDLRLWRSRRRDNFGRDDLRLLDDVGRAFAAALKSARALTAAGTAKRLDADAFGERFGLTRREAEVAALAAQGLGDAEIGERLGIGHATVRTHLGRVFQKAEVTSRSALAACILG
jgi:DNA-binding CsgD family transcriptional regulator